VASGDDPLARVFDLDTAHVRRGLIIGVIGALIVHVAGASEAARLANGLGGWARETRSSVHEYLERLYEVEMVNAPPPPPPPPEEKPEPETPKPPAAAPKPPRDEPPPAPAQAGKILTQEPDPNAPVDLTGQGFVTGNAETYAGGVTASNGTSASAVHNLNAVPSGVPGGTGTKPAPPGPPPGPGLSRPASIEGDTEWHCPFPPEANAEEINYQRVHIAVSVRPDGRPDSVRVIGDPGHGFGREARSCALRNRYRPALDRDGHPIQATIPINITFTR
jgi:periplasmic protein TonB